MKKFRKKPIVIEAEQWFQGKEIDGVTLFIPVKEGIEESEYYIPTSAGMMIVREGDWIIKGIEGELYPCKDSIFKETYESVNPWGNE